MTGPALAEFLGWAATAVITGSYFCKGPVALRRVQMLGALMWASYGLLLGLPPVVAANLLVLVAAAWTARSPALRGGAPKE